MNVKKKRRCNTISLSLSLSLSLSETEEPSKEQSSTNYNSIPWHCSYPYFFCTHLVNLFVGCRHRVSVKVDAN